MFTSLGLQIHFQNVHVCIRFFRVAGTCSRNLSVSLCFYMQPGVHSSYRGMSHCVEGIYRKEAECENVMVIMPTVVEACSLLGQDKCVLLSRHHSSFSKST